MEEEANKEYRWESGYEKTWEAIQENRDGLLEFSVQDIILKARRKRLAERDSAYQRVRRRRSNIRRWGGNGRDEGNDEDAHEHDDGAKHEGPGG